MLRCFPTSIHRVQELRRRSALAFLLSDQSLCSTPSHKTFSLTRIIAQLDEPRFEISDKTDYLNLGALIAIMDIAVENGQSADLDGENEAREETFNQEIDILGARIKMIWSSINDGGTAFISRSEAKEVMESVRYRLTYAVRTKQKPKESVFDTPRDEEDLQKQSTFMKNFFKPKIQ
jgi:hypothetical protein